MAVLALCGVLAGCHVIGGGSDSATPSASFRCRVKFDSPYRPVVTSAGLIRGHASALCTQKVDSHVVTLYLELQSGRSWLIKDRDASEEVPYPKAIGLQVLEAECQVGTWRLRYNVKATYQGRAGTAGDGSSFLVIRSDKDCTYAH